MNLSATTWGGVYQTKTYAVDPSTGTVGNALIGNNCTTKTQPRGFHREQKNGTGAINLTPGKKTGHGKKTGQGAKNGRGKGSEAIFKLPVP